MPGDSSSQPLGSAPDTVDPHQVLTDEELFRLQVQIDLQRERELLYRVALVIEAVFALLLIREWLLWLTASA